MSIKEGFIRLLYDFMGVIIGAICDMMSDIIGHLSDIIGLWWVLKSKGDTIKKMRNEKCWTKKGDYDHFGCVLGVLATVFAIWSRFWVLGRTQNLG